MSIALGFVLGMFPIFGLPTLLCAAATLVLRLNTPAVQLVNYLVYPLQLALLSPFVHLGRQLFPIGRSSTVIPRISALLHESIGRAASEIARAAAHAVAGWFLICVPAGVLIYIVTARYLRSKIRQHAEG